MEYKELENLCDKNLITAEQREAIAEALKIGPYSKPRNYLFAILCSLGGILILAGTIMLISANWECISPRVKQTASSLLLLAFWVAGLKFLFQKNPRPAVGDVFCCLGAGMFLACIALYGQIYQISSEAWKPFFAWFVGIAAFPWILKLRGVFVLSVLAAFVSWQTFADGTLSVNDIYFSDCAFFIALAALGVFFKNSRSEKMRAYAPVLCFGAFSIAAAIAFSCCFSVTAFEKSAFLVVAGTLLFAAAQIRDVFRSSEKSREFGFLFAGMQSLLLALPFVLSFMWEHDEVEVAAIGTFFAAGTVTMVWGAKTNDKFHINTGMVFVLLSGLAVWIRVVNTLSTSGFILLASGLFFLVFAWGLMRSRKILTEKFKEKTVPEENLTENNEQI